MLSHSSTVKKCSRTRKPSSRNWKRRGDCSSPESSGEAAQSKREQFWPFAVPQLSVKSIPTSALQLDTLLLIFNVRRGFYCKKDSLLTGSDTIQLQTVYLNAPVHKAEKISSLEPLWLKDILSRMCDQQLLNYKSC